jgi:hypothetical protein
MKSNLYRWWRMLLHPSQAYYWTKRWQADEERADAEIDAGLCAPISDAELIEMVKRCREVPPGMFID